jgi:hypothetical protein
MSTTSADGTELTSASGGNFRPSPKRTFADPLLWNVDDCFAQEADIPFAQAEL